MKVLRIAAFGTLLLLSARIGSAADEPKKAAEKKPGFDVTLVDKSVSPCANFYQYACGGWIAANPIPPEYSFWGRFNELADRNREPPGHPREGVEARSRA